MEQLDKATFLIWMERIMLALDELKCTNRKIPNRPVIDGEPLIDNQEVCIMLQISKRTLQRYRASKELPFYIIYHKSWYRESEILTFMQKHFDRNSDDTNRRVRTRIQKKFKL